MDVNTTGVTLHSSAGGSSGSRSSTPTTAVRLRPRIPPTLTGSGSKHDPREDGGGGVAYLFHHQHRYHHQPKQQQALTTGNARIPATESNPQTSNNHFLPNREDVEFPNRTVSSPPPLLLPPSSQIMQAPPTSNELRSFVSSNSRNQVVSSASPRQQDVSDDVTVTRPQTDSTQPIGEFDDVIRDDDDAVVVFQDDDRQFPLSLFSGNGKPSSSSSASVIRAKSLVVRKNSSPTPVLPVPNDFRSRTVIRPLAEKPSDDPSSVPGHHHVTTWETESLGSPVDASRSFEIDVQRPNSENSVLRPEVVMREGEVRGSGVTRPAVVAGSRLGQADSKHLCQGDGSAGAEGPLARGGMPVIRSFSLRKLRKLDRIVTSEVGKQSTRPNGSRFEHQGAPSMRGKALEAMEFSGDARDSYTGVSGHRPVDQTGQHPTFVAHSLGGHSLGGHSPGGEGSAARHQESVGSNGLGDASTVDQSEVDNSSVHSLDSHACPSDDGAASEAVSFPSDSTLEEDGGGGGGGGGGAVERLDRKNNRSLKQKSRSDPSAEKNTTEGAATDRTASLANIGVYAQSSPVLVEDKQRFCFGPADQPDPGQPDDEQRHSFPGLSTSSPEDTEVKGVLRGEDSFEDQTPTSIKPPRPRVYKRRPRVTVPSSGDQAPPEQSRKTSASREDKAKKPSDLEPLPAVPSTAGPSSSTQPNHRGKPVLPSSLTLPLAKKTPALLQSQNFFESGERTPEAHPELQSPDEDPTSAVSSTLRSRHSSSSGSGAGAARADYRQRANTGGIKSMTSAIGGSVQELYRSASPRFKTGSGSTTTATATTPGSASFSPSLDTILSHSTLSLFEGAAEDKDKRDLILQEFYSTEKQYVEALQLLVERYMIPLKTQSLVDSSIVDEIFYKINEIYMHHATFITFLDRTLKDWTSQSTIGDIIYKNFSKQTVIDSYTSFIEHFPRSEKVLDEVSNKSSFQKLIEQCEKETRTKLPLKAQLVKPAQRIPRYELLIKRLLDNTPSHHPDYPLLHQAERAIHELALRINSVKESKHEEDLQETLKKLELLLITDLVSPDRLYLRHDMVSIPSRKDQTSCVWLFSDLLIISSIKRKSTSVNRRTSLLLQSPSGHDFVENTKHKIWLKVPLDSTDLVQGPEVAEACRQLADRQDLEADYETLGKMVELTARLKFPHQVVDDAVSEVFRQVNRQLAEHQLRTPPPEEQFVLEIVASTREGPVNLSLVFPSVEKKSSWETTFLALRQKLVQVTDRMLPEFLQPLPITKTRAGMQFSCAAATEPSSTRLDREVLVCNSDGYVGHMCLLNLIPEPIVTLNTPVPGCNSRILCICAVPPYQEPKRPPRIRIEERRSEEDEEDEERAGGGGRGGGGRGGRGDGKGASSPDSGTNSDSESESEEEDEDEERQEANTGGAKPCSLPSSPSSMTSKTPGDSPVTIDRGKSTVWLGTEDGCIQIFASTENIKTTKSKIKVQHNASILSIVYLNSRVFVSVANGDIVIYKRNRTDGTWDCSNPEVVTVSTSGSPINRLIAVNDRLWAACHSDILVLTPPSVDVEARFSVSQDPRQGISCLASQGHGVWVNGRNSSRIVLYHATSYEQILDVNVAFAVSQKLQSADDIIRQHKMACLRITALLCCKTMLWIGTSAGIILTLPLPTIKATWTKHTVVSPPSITGLPHGHTGHVRFLTCVETTLSSSSSSSSTVTNPRPAAHSSSSSSSSSSSGFNSSPGSSVNMLVISGGDGYEDFRSTSTSGSGGGGGGGGGGGAGAGGGEMAGRDDSTNHLLLWRV